MSLVNKTTHSILKELVGLTESDAAAKISAAGMKSRIISKNGQAYVGTRDYCMDRVNLIVEKNLVIKASLG